MWLELRLIFLGALVVVCCVRLGLCNIHALAIGRDGRGGSFATAGAAASAAAIASGWLRRARWTRWAPRDGGGARSGLQALSLAAMRGSTSPSTAGLALAYAHGVRMRCVRRMWDRRLPCSYALNIVVNLNMSVRGGVFCPFPSRRVRCRGCSYAFARL